MPISRTWYDSLINDDGTNLTGTVWDKAAVNSLLNAIDAFVGDTVVGWTPIDSSGAGLTFTYPASALYRFVGHLIVATCAIQFPVTANTSNVLIGGLPFPAVAGAQFGAVIQYTTWNQPDATIMLNLGASNLSLFNRAGVAYRNVDLSGKDLRFTLTYFST